MFEQHNSHYQLIEVLSFLGFLVAAYTYFVERKIKESRSYKPICDINDIVSCTKPMQSPYSAIFYVSNALAAMGYYALVIVLALLGLPKLLLLATGIGFLVSVVLAYLLYVKVRALCLLCTTMYIINVLLLLLSWRLM